MTPTAWFVAEFECVKCKEVVAIRVRQAVVDSQTGARCMCKCGQPYRVRRGGATPITEESDVAFIDAAGKPYHYPKEG